MQSEPALNNLLSAFLDEIGVQRVGVIKFGPKPDTAPAAEPSPAQRRKLLEGLALAGRGSRSIIWLWVALIIGLFMLVAGFAVYHHDNTAFVTAAILGGSGAMSILLKQMRSVHLRMVSTQVLLTLLPNLAPAEWSKVVQSLLEEVLNASK
jgi:hypothetical protein